MTVASKHHRTLVFHVIRVGGVLEYVYDYTYSETSEQGTPNLCTVLSLVEMFSLNSSVKYTTLHAWYSQNI